MIFPAILAPVILVSPFIIKIVQVCKSIWDFNCMHFYKLSHCLNSSDYIFLAETSGTACTFLLRHLVQPVLKNNSSSGVAIWHVFQQICQPPAHLHAQDLPFYGAAPYLSHLQHPFATGSVISVTGTLHHDTEWWVQTEHPVECIRAALCLMVSANRTSCRVHQSCTVFNGECKQNIL